MENNRIKELELQMEELKLKMDVEIIRPYLESNGFDLTPKHEYDRAGYYVARRGNLRYLAFGILRYDPNPLCIDEYKKGDCGQIVYDVDGNVLVDCIDNRSDNCVFLLGDAEHYEEIDSSYVFMDDYVLFDGHKHWKSPFDDTTKVEGEIIYEIYKFDGNKYKHYDRYTDICSESDAVLKASDGELFINGRGKLYGVRDARYLNNIKFKDICGVKGISSRIEYLTDGVKNMINDKLKKDNVLFAYDHIYANGHYGKDATIFVFLDTKGNIVSKLYFKTDKKFLALDVDNDSYNEVVNACKAVMQADSKREADNERRREQRLATREFNLRKKANVEMITTLEDDLCKNDESKEVVKIK